MTTLEGMSADPTVSALEYYSGVVRSTETAADDWRDKGRFRLDLDPRAGTGRLECVRFSGGLTLMSTFHDLRRPLTAAYSPTRPAFGLSFQLSGDFDVSLPCRPASERMTAGRVWMRAGDLPGPIVATTPAGESMRGVSLDVPESFARAWRDEAPRSVALGAARLLSEGGAPFTPLMSIDAETRAAVEATLRLDLSTLHGRLVAESVALGLLARVLAPGSDDVGSAPPSAILDDAADILNDEWADPPTISRLARRVGTNECYLKAGFRERFGTTIAAFVRDRRMREARRMIEERGCSVQVAAVEVGFSNPSRFAAAFRKVHGVNPSSLLRSRTDGRR